MVWVLVVCNSFFAGLILAASVVDALYRVSSYTVAVAELYLGVLVRLGLRTMHNSAKRVADESRGGDAAQVPVQASPGLGGLGAGAGAIPKPRRESALAGGGGENADADADVDPGAAPRAGPKRGVFSSIGSLGSVGSSGGGAGAGAGAARAETTMMTTMR